MSLEKQLENRLVKAVKAMGGRAIKMPAMWNKGIPDRMILMPNGAVYFVELKAGSAVSKSQKEWIKWLTKNYFDARVVEGKTELEEFIKEIRDDPR